MSIQDESFPEDEFLKELDFLPNDGRRFHKRQNREHKPPASTTNTSSSSTDQNLSGESTNGRPSSGLSSKTTESEPANLADASKKQNELSEINESKAISYQDIHNEYTKRRYKHVESKVGQYIANFKAEDEKRKKLAKFQRHHSMPDTLSGAGAKSNARRRNELVRYSAAELHKTDESTSDAEADSSENTTGQTSSSSRNQHESSDDTNAAAGDFIDKQTYASLVIENERIQSYMEYLQVKLDEKNCENMRLKRNLETMRIELSNCKDKLKKVNAGVGAKEMGGSFGNISIGGGVACGGLLRNSLQGLMYNQSGIAKATQTEVITLMLPPPAPPLYVTPNTPDTNNNETFDGGAAANCKSSAKNVATIQPLSLNFSNIVEQDSGEGSSNGVLRQRTNSNPSTKGAPAPKASNASCPSSSDSAIDIESVELTSPKPNLRKLISPKQSKREEFIYYDERTGRFAALQTRNATGSSDDENNVTLNDGLSPTNTTGDSGDKRSTKNKRKISFLRRRFLRFFGPCTRCNENLDASALQQTYTQIPLLDKSFENHCRNFH